MFAFLLAVLKVKLPKGKKREDFQLAQLNRS